MEMLDKVAEYTQSKSEAAEMLDNEWEKWHNKTDVDNTLADHEDDDNWNNNLCLSWWQTRIVGIGFVK